MGLLFCFQSPDDEGSNIYGNDPGNTSPEHLAGDDLYGNDSHLRVAVPAQSTSAKDKVAKHDYVNVQAAVAKANQKDLAPPSNQCHPRKLHTYINEPRHKGKTKDYQNMTSVLADDSKKRPRVASIYPEGEDAKQQI